MIDHYRAVRAGLYEAFAAAVEAGDRSGTAQLAGRLIQACDSIARVTGQLSSRPLLPYRTTSRNIVTLPAFGALQAALLRALADFPDARAAVIAEFRKLECQDQPAAKAAPLLELSHSDHGRPAS